LNKDILINKYKDLIPVYEDDFVSDVNLFKSKLNSDSLNNRPVLIYNRNKRNALYYTLCLYYSLKNEHVLDYTVIAGQTLINQHFMTEENRDEKIYNAAFYSDITFISLSQFDYSSEFLESLIIELIEFRNTNKKLTIISYDILDSDKSNYISLTRKLHAYFLANKYNIIELENIIHDAKERQQINTTKKRGRII